MPPLGRSALLGAVLFSTSACTGAGGCGSQSMGAPIPGHINRSVIAQNVVQARLSPEGFAFVESDLIALIEGALGKPLAFKIPRQEIAWGLVACDFPEGCDASVTVVPNTLAIERVAPDADGRTMLRVTGLIEVAASRVMFFPGEPLFKGDTTGSTRDCQIDVQYKNHYAETCRSRGVSWAKSTDPVNTRNACNTYCQNTATEPGRAVGVAVLVSIDQTLGHPRLEVDSVDVTFSGVTDCPVTADVRVFQPNKSFSCADGSGNCAIFEQTKLVQAPMFCGVFQPLYDILNAAFSSALKDGARYAVNAELAKVLSVPCSQDTDCQRGTRCSKVKMTAGWGCGPDGACLMAPEEAMVCNDGVRPVPPLAGVEAQMDLATLSPSFAPNTSGPVGFIAGLGGFVAADSDSDLSMLRVPAQNANRGLTIGGFLGLDAARSSCVAPKARPQARTVEPLILPSTVELYDGQARQIQELGYHAAISLSQDALAQIAHAMYENGVLCMAFASVEELQLNSKLLALLVSSLDQLEEGKPRPAFLNIFPEEVPTFAIGQGTLAPDGTVASPHLGLSVERLNIEFYSMVSERFVRLFTLKVDFQAGVFLDFTADGKLLPLTSDLKGGLTNVTVSDVEILAEKADDLQKILPALLDFALPMVTAAMLKEFPLPDRTVVPGYRLDILGMRGTRPIPTEASAHFDFPHFEFLSVFARLSKIAPSRALPIAANAQVELRGVEVERGADLLDLAHAPTVRLGITADDDVEIAYRVGDELFGPFTQDRELAVSRPAFRLEGPKRLEVIARRLGEPATTGKPTELVVTIPKPEPALAMAPLAPTSSTTSKRGCATAAPPSLLAGFVMMLALLRARRGASGPNAKKD